MENAKIENGRVSGIIYGQYFSVALNKGSNPSICPDINFEGMPIKTLIKLAFDSMKVKGRSHMRKMDEDQLKKVYSGEISWRVMIDKAGALEQLASVEMSETELEATIKRLQAMQGKLVEDTDNQIENIDN